MPRMLSIVLACAFFLLSCFVAIRFVLGGDEDTWLCQGGAWVMHGHPQAPMPTTPCAK